MNVVCLYNNVKYGDWHAHCWCMLHGELPREVIYGIEVHINEETAPASRMIEEQIFYENVSEVQRDAISSAPAIVDLSLPAQAPATSDVSETAR